MICPTSPLLNSGDQKVHLSGRQAGRSALAGFVVEVDFDSILPRLEAHASFSSGFSKKDFSPYRATCREHLRTGKGGSEEKVARNYSLFCVPVVTSSSYYS